MFTLNKIHRNVKDDDLLNDVKDVCQKLGLKTITIDIYNQHGKYHASTLIRRFKSWFKVLEMCNLTATRSKINIPEKELFSNLERIWLQLGRQPKYKEICKPLSTYSVGTYEARFGSWYKALEAFIQYISRSPNKTEEKIETPKHTQRHSTKRIPSNRLKIQVLMRDGNRCRICGVECNDGLHNIHFDHIKPWSKGGETILENLQVLCEKCNLAKGDLDLENNE